MSYSGLYRELPHVFGISSTNIKLSDRRFHIVRYDDIVKFYKETTVNLLTYFPENFDCDDFALVVTALFKINPGWELVCHGYAWSDYHAFNVFKCDKGWFVAEPQNDKIIPARDAIANAFYRPTQLIRI